MVPDKEAKKYTYKLLEENFIQLTQLSRPAATSGPGINKVFYLFHVNLDAVSNNFFKFLPMTWK